MITPIPADTPTPHNPSAQPDPSPPAPHPPTQRPSLFPTLTATALAIILAIASGVIGALTVLHFRTDTPETRFAVIDMQQISQAITETFGRDPKALEDFTVRFETALRDFEADNPSRVLLVKEAVLTGDVEDATPALFALLKLSPSNTPTTTGRDASRDKAKRIR
jgi:hypothetical protein